MKAVRLICFLALLFLPSTLFAQEDEISLDSLTLILDNDSISTDTMDVYVPKEEYDDDLIYVHPTSHIIVPISINVPTLEKRVNEAFTGLLYEDNDLKDDGLELKAWKAKDFKFRMVDDTLIYTVPIKIWANKEFDLGITTTVREINAEIEAEFATSMQLTPDWKIKSSTQLVNYKWTRRPTIKVLGQDVSVGFITDILIKRNKALITSQLDNAISENLQLPKYVEELWNDLHNPIPVSTYGYNAWISTQPDKISCTPIRGLNNKINTTVQIDTKVKVFVGKEPRKSFQKFLPKLNIQEELGDSLDLRFLADLPYTMMDSIASSFLVGETFGEGRKQIKVDSIAFYPGGDKLVIALQVSGFINGKLYLEGVPYFDSEKVEIRIRDVDYTVKSKNVLVKIVNLFYKKGMKRMIEEKMVISLKDEFFLLKDIGNSALFDSEMIPGVKMNGRIDRIDVHGIFTGKHSLNVDLEVVGALHVNME